MEKCTSKQIYRRGIFMYYTEKMDIFIQKFPIRKGNRVLYTVNMQY